MNNQVLQHFDAAVRALPSVTFKAWCGDRPMRGLGGVQEFTEALARCFANNPVPHKSILTILREDAGRCEKELRFYVIKQSTKRGTWRDATNGGRRVFVGNLEPHLLHALAVREFVPVEAFDAFKGDASGVDRTLIELRAKRVAAADGGGDSER